MTPVSRSSLGILTIDSAGCFGLVGGYYGAEPEDYPYDKPLLKVVKSLKKLRQLDLGYGGQASHHPNPFLCFSSLSICRRLWLVGWRMLWFCATLLR